MTIIGEAAKRVPKSVRDRYPQVPWKKMAAMRDIITHEYFGVDLQRVFNTLREDLPALPSTIYRILADLEDG